MRREVAVIIEAYLAGHLSVETAAQRLLSLGPASGGHWNIEMSPRIRRLMAELHRLQTGRTVPASWLLPDPTRHEGGNLQLLNGIEARYWSALADREKPARLDCRFLAANEEAAYRLAAWLKNGGHTVKVKPPDGVDEEEWSILGTTDHRLWTRKLLEDWIQLLRSAPLEGAASIMGLGLLQD